MFIKTFSEEFDISTWPSFR